MRSLREGLALLRFNIFFSSFSCFSDANGLESLFVQNENMSKHILYCLYSGCLAVCGDQGCNPEMENYDYRIF